MSGRDSTSPATAREHVARSAPTHNREITSRGHCLLSTPSQDMRDESLRDGPRARLAPTWTRRNYRRLLLYSLRVIRPGCVVQMFEHALQQPIRRAVLLKGAETSPEGYKCDTVLNVLRTQSLTRCIGRVGEVRAS